MMKWNILEETPDWVAVDKPAGLLSIPDRLGQEPSLKDALKQQYGAIYTVHRIDRETSGVIVFAKTPEAHQALSALFEGREIEKYYLGLVMGNLINPKDSILAPMMEHPGKAGRMITHAKGKAAHTDYEVVASFRGYSWVKCRIHTGRTHQIRLHMQHIGHPIVCDAWYGDGAPILLSSLKKKFKLSKMEDAERPILNRLGLHAEQLIFNWKEKQYTIQAPIPKDLRATLQQLEKWCPQ